MDVGVQERLEAAVDGRPRRNPCNERLRKGGAELGVAYGHLGDVAWEEGDLVAAEEASRRSLATAEWLAVLDPDNVQWQEDLERAWFRNSRFGG